VRRSADRRHESRLQPWPRPAGSRVILPVVGQRSERRSRPLGLSTTGHCAPTAWRLSRARRSDRLTAVPFSPVPCCQTGSSDRRGRSPLELDLAVDKGPGLARRGDAQLLDNIVPRLDRFGQPVTASASEPPRPAGLRSGRPNLARPTPTPERASIRAPFRLSSRGEGFWSGERLAQAMTRPGSSIWSSFGSRPRSLNTIPSYIKIVGEAIITAAAVARPPDQRAASAAILPNRRQLPRPPSGHRGHRPQWRAQPWISADVRLERPDCPNRTVVPAAAVIEPNGPAARVRVRVGRSQWVIRVPRAYERVLIPRCCPTAVRTAASRPADTVLSSASHPHPDCAVRLHRQTVYPRQHRRSRSDVDRAERRLRRPVTTSPPPSRWSFRRAVSLASSLYPCLPAVQLPVLTIGPAYPGAAAEEVSASISERLVRRGRDARLGRSRSVSRNGEVTTTSSLPGHRYGRDRAAGARAARQRARMLPDGAERPHPPHHDPANDRSLCLGSRAPAISSSEHLPTVEGTCTPRRLDQLAGIAASRWS